MCFKLYNTSFTKYKFEEEINLLYRIIATNIFGAFLGTGGAY